MPSQRIGLCAHCPFISTIDLETGIPQSNSSHCPANLAPGPSPAAGFLQQFRAGRCQADFNADLLVAEEAGGVRLTYVDPHSGGATRKRAVVHVKCDRALRPGLVAQVWAEARLSAVLGSRPRVNNGKDVDKNKEICEPSKSQSKWLSKGFFPRKPLGPIYEPQLHIFKPLILSPSVDQSFYGL